MQNNNISIRNPKVTVLMSVLNNERTVYQAIDSILTQTFQDFEFIILDDGSTDGSRNMIKAIMTSSVHGEKIILIENPETYGLARSLNIGIERARGVYIVRMDADDVSMSDRLQRQVAFMDSNPAIGISGTWAMMVGAEYGFSPKGPAIGHQELASAPQAPVIPFKTSIWKNPTKDIEMRGLLFFSNCILHPTVIMRKAILDQYALRYNEAYSSAQDYELWSRALWHTQFANIPRPLLAYRVHDSSVTSSKREVQQENSKNIRRRMLETLGLKPTERDLDLHEISRASNWSEGGPIVFLQKKQAWLMRIKSALVTSYTGKGSFDDIFAKVWLSVCIENRGQRLNLWTTYWTSTLAKMTPKNLIRALKLLNDRL